MKQFIIILFSGILLSGCYTAEQSNPFILSPCKSILTDNKINLSGYEYILEAGDNYINTNEDGSYQIGALLAEQLLIIEINEQELTRTNKLYRVERSDDRAPGTATVTLVHDAGDSYAYSGDLYLSYDKDHWVVELCGVEIDTEYSSWNLQGRFLCNW